MKLSISNVANDDAWMRKNYALPQYDIIKAHKATKEKPRWLHFGAGNIFRIFPARLQQELMNKGEAIEGIMICETFDEEIISKAFTPYDNLCIAVTLKSDKIVEKEIVASIAQSLTLTGEKKELLRIFIAPSMQIVSFTITEKGYSVVGEDGAYLVHIQNDIDHEPEKAHSLMGLTAYLCHERYKAGKYPIALVSLDNCAHNGDQLKKGILTVAKGWLGNGWVEEGFIQYLEDNQRVSFPWSMIDKITPRPSEAVKEMLEADDCEEVEIVSTSKNTYVSCFVNAEEAEYLVIEEAFPNGRPPLEKAGVLFTDRQTVDKVEKMKVGACLNPLHTILAVYGCLMDYHYIYEEMQNEEMVQFIKKVGYEESLPYVENPGILEPVDFITQVIENRFPNPYIPDTPQRIASDTSQKIPVRFGDTLKAMLRQGKNIKELVYIPLFFAGWLRYLVGINDMGEAFQLSPDPMHPVLQNHMSGIRLGSEGPFTDQLQPILSNAAIFGVDLYQYGLGEKVEGYFEELIKEKGSVRNTLKKYCLDPLSMSQEMERKSK